MAKKLPEEAAKIYELAMQGYSIIEIADGMQLTISTVEQAIDDYKATIPIIVELRDKAKQIRNLVVKDEWLLKDAISEVLGKKALGELREIKYPPGKLAEDLGLSVGEARKALRRKEEGTLVLTSNDLDTFFRNKGEVVSRVEFRVLQMLADRLAEDPDSFSNTQLIKFQKQLAEIGLKLPNKKTRLLPEEFGKEVSLELNKFKNAIHVNGKLAQVEVDDENKTI